GPRGRPHRRRGCPPVPTKSLPARNACVRRATPPHRAPRTQSAAHRPSTRTPETPYPRRSRGPPLAVIPWPTLNNDSPNSPLAPVLATAERRGFSKLLVAGDLCFPGPAPLATWRRLTAANAICVQGVGDRALATVDLDNLRATSEHERARLDRLRSTRSDLGE